MQKPERPRYCGLLGGHASGGAERGGQLRQQTRLCSLGDSSSSPTRVSHGTVDFLLSFDLLPVMLVFMAQK